jgi:DNA-binding protein H-NS
MEERMALNETIKHMRELLAAISVDLEKAAGGNKAASQRVRTGTIRLEKIAKNYRKESIHAEKMGGSTKRTGSRKASSKARSKGAAKVKAHPKAKAIHAPGKRNPMVMKRHTAKIPFKKA